MLRALVDRSTGRTRSRVRLPAPATVWLLALGAAGLAASGTVQAQQTGSITGRVANAASNAPVTSAQVTISGTSLGALTRSDGRFLIPGVPAGTHEVVASSIGFATETETVTVAAGETAELVFELREQAVALEELVVTGVGAEARRREIGNSLAQIDMAEVAAKPIDDVESLLRGSVAGVQGLSVSGQVGAGGTIQLRGVTSVSQGNAPLIYVDGVRLSTARVPPANLEDGRGPRTSGMALNNLNPQDIARIEIIKGAAATTLYGTEASAGVIQIFTKKGVAGAPQWSFSATGGQNFWPQVGSVIQDHETDLDLNKVRRTGWVQRYNGSVRGGGEDLQYFISGHLTDEEGIVDTQGANAWGLTGNFTLQLTDGLTVQFNNAYSRHRTRYVPDSNNRHGYILNVMRLDQDYWPGNADDSWILDTELVGETDDFVSGLRFDYVTGGLRNRIQLGLHHLEAANSGLLPFGYYLYPNGSIGVTRWRDRTLTFDYTGTWQTDLSDQLRSTVTWGGQLYDERRLNIEAGGLDFSGPGNPTISSAARTASAQSEIREVNAGFFVQETVGWRDRLFLIGGLRVDGSSTFGEDYGFQYYPKLSMSYVISDEDFWQWSWWNSLRLRAALGEAGRAPGAFDAVRTWNPIAGLEAQPGVTPDNLGNANLGPERTRELELGFDASLFASRLGVELTYYDARTYDALFPVLPVPSQGFSGSQVRNVGELRSKGLELSANALLVDADALAWNVGVNLTTTDSEVTDMGGAAPFSVDYEQGIREGYAPPSFFGRKVLNPNELAEPEFEPDTYLGNTFPTTIVGLLTDVTLGGSLSLSAIGEFNRGGHIVNATAYLNTVRGIWPTCTGPQQLDEAGNRDQLTALQRAGCLSGLRGYDQFIESGDFFKLRDVTLRYTIPTSWIPAAVSSATLAISGRDLLKVTDYTGLDPEVVEGGSSGLSNFRRVEYYTLPPYRSITAKLSFTF